MKAILTTFLILIVLGFTTSCRQPAGQSEEEVKALAMQSLDFYNTGDFSTVNEVFNDDFVQHWLSRDIEIVGIEAFVEIVTANRKNAPDLNMTIEDIGATGDRCFVRWTATASWTIPDIPSITDKEVEFSGISIYRIVDGKISEEWYAYNHASWLTQLGYTITPPTAEEEE